MKRERRAFADYRDDELVPVLERLHFLDEFGAHLGMTRTYGRAAPGKRVGEGTPDYSGPHDSVVASLSLNGVEAPWVIEGAMNGAAFATYSEHVLGPTLQAGDLLIIDNLSANKNAAARAALEARGVQVVFLPPTRPTSIRSSCVGPRSRRPCARPKPAPSTPCWTPCTPRSSRSCPNMPTPGSSIVVMSRRKSFREPL